jgi:hypothetical protein
MLASEESCSKAKRSLLGASKACTSTDTALERHTSSTAQHPAHNQHLAWDRDVGQPHGAMFPRGAAFPILTPCWKDCAHACTSPSGKGKMQLCLQQPAAFCCLPNRRCTGDARERRAASWAAAAAPQALALPDLAACPPAATATQRQASQWVGDPRWTPPAGGPPLAGLS